MNQLKGYTIIEILVVLFIISIATGVALLGISQNENKKIESFTKELTQLITLAEEQAMLQPAIIGLSFDADAFQFARFEAINKKRERWLMLNDRMLGKHPIPSNIQLDIRASVSDKNKEKDEDADKKEEGFTPQIIIST